VVEEMQERGKLSGASEGVRLTVDRSAPMRCDETDTGELNALAIRAWYVLIGFASATGLFLQFEIGGVWWIMTYIALLIFVAGDEPISTGSKN
jgi:hypothetical protein